MNDLIFFAKDALLSSLKMTVNQTSFRTISYTVQSTDEENGVFTYHFKGEDTSFLEKLDVTARVQGNTVIFSIDMKRDDDICGLYTLLPEKCVEFPLCEGIETDDILASTHAGAWWMFPEFLSSVKELKPMTQGLVMKLGDKHCHLLPLCGDNFRCEFGEGKAYLSTGTSGITNIKGDFLAVTVADDPFEAVKCNYENARAAGAIRVPLREEREYPELFEGFGFCTWNAFYHDLSSAKIYEKLDEFKEKNIPIKWMIIDDGWSTYDGMYLTSFGSDYTKIPEGLETLIKRIKNDYGVEKVGVWHSYLGYWHGVDPDSELYRDQKDNLVRTEQGLYIPAFDEEKAFKFWDAWHSSLKAAGVDFLKIDNQSSLSHRAQGIMATSEAARISHNAIERSVIKNFGGDMINCMGMDMENVLARPTTGVSRNSDDFFPGVNRNFIPHVIQNCYNAVWHSMMYHCDYDMWWSCHESAVQSGVLRAISGSPIYVSDAIGGTVRDAIMPTIEEDGTIIRCDDAARPTRDCFYTDCRHSGTLQKIWNRNGEAFAVAFFNIGIGECKRDITDTIDIADVPGMEGEYVAYDYFAKTFTRVKAGDKLTKTLVPDGTGLYNFYPVLSDENGEYIMLGNVEKYISIGTVDAEKKYLCEIL